MKVTWIIPPTMNVETIVRSLPASRYRGMEVNSVFLPDTIDTVLAGRPDVVLYIGAVSGMHSLSPHYLKQLKQSCKTVNIWCLGGDKEAFPLIDTFNREDTFTLQVSIDGNTEVPLRPQDLIQIGCVDPTPYKNYQVTGKAEKDIELGVVAAYSPLRDAFLGELGDLVTRGKRTESFGLHGPYVEFLSRCKRLLNVNWFSTNTNSTGVNSKVFECAYAHTVLLEKKGSYIGNYFKAGEEFLEYETASDVKEILSDCTRLTSVSNKLWQRVHLDYSNTAFWEKVFSRLSELH